MIKVFSRKKQIMEAENVELSLSVEETNRLRQSLGLAPLKTSIPKDAEESSNYSKFVNEKAKLQKAKELEDRLNNSRLLRQQRAIDQNCSLTLGEENDDASSWVEASKKRTDDMKKIIQASKVIEKPSLEAYSLDNADLRVAHSMDVFVDTINDNEILVLKDSEILSKVSNGDELVSLRVQDHEHISRNAREKKRRVYDPTEHPSSLLSQYDEEEKERPSFKPDDRITRRPVELNYKLADVDDYMSKDEMTTKFKSKTKRKRKQIRKESSNDMTNSSMPIDESFSLTRVSNLRGVIEPENFVDDDDLQIAIAQTRGQALKSRPMDIAKEVEQTTTLLMNKVNSEDSKSEKLVMSDTSEFVRHLPHLAVQVSEQSGISNKTTNIKDVNETDKFPDINDSSMKLDEYVEELDSGPDIPSFTQSMPVELEKNRGIGNTMEILRQQGLMETKTEMSEAELNAVKQNTWREKNLSSKDVKEQVKTRSRGRDDDKRLRDTVERYKDYKPDVNIVYKDEYGRELNTKEAWKQLCHRFHGNDSGKKKKEKNLNRIARDMKAKMISETDRMASVKAIQDKQKQLGTAHIVLSGKNRSELEVLPTPVMASVTAHASVRNTGSSKQLLVSNNIASATDASESTLAPNRDKVQFGLKSK